MDNDIFLHMGCDNELAKEAAALARATVVAQMYAGSKLMGGSIVRQKYFSEYRRLEKDREVTSITRNP